MYIPWQFRTWTGTFPIWVIVWPLKLRSDMLNSRLNSLLLKIVLSCLHFQLKRFKKSPFLFLTASLSRSLKATRS